MYVYYSKHVCIRSITVGAILVANLSPMSRAVSIMVASERLKPKTQQSLVFSNSDYCCSDLAIALPRLLNCLGSF